MVLPFSCLGDRHTSRRRVALDTDLSPSASLTGLARLSLVRRPVTSLSTYDRGRPGARLVVVAGSRPSRARYHGPPWGLMPPARRCRLPVLERRPARTWDQPRPTHEG